MNHNFVEITEQAIAVYFETYDALFLEEQVLTLQAEQFSDLLLEVYLVLGRF
jgi:hypothetical protein